ncbi:MAG: hypothetical protein GY786_25320, partial [Proteobacteria bacterium]|nr:hypothetical protein [Pseudomonadota bacterium]
ENDSAFTPDLYQLEENISLFTSALIDWTDTNTDPDYSIDYGNGGEDYYDEVPSFQVKNREIEFLGELKLIPSFRELKLTGSEITTNFRPYYSKTNVPEAIDLNLATKQEIINFINRYQSFSDEYPNILDNAEKIAEVAKDQESDNFSAKYEGKSYLGSLWQDDVEQITG